MIIEITFPFFQKGGNYCLANLPFFQKFTRLAMNCRPFRDYERGHNLQSQRDGSS